MSIQWQLDPIFAPPTFRNKFSFCKVYSVIASDSERRIKVLIRRHLSPANFNRASSSPRIIARCLTVCRAVIRLKWLHNSRESFHCFYDRSYQAKMANRTIKKCRSISNCLCIPIKANDCLWHWWEKTWGVSAKKLCIADVSGFFLFLSLLDGVT